MQYFTRDTLEDTLAQIADFESDSYKYFSWKKENKKKRNISAK